MIFVLTVAGLMLGVLVNGLADNLPPDALGGRRLSARPRCPHCGAPHAAAFALSLSAFLLRAGHCEHCGAPRRLRHGLAELSGAALLPLLWNWSGGDWMRFAPAAVISAVFLLIAVIDIEHRLILQAVSLPAAGLFILAGAAAPGHGLVKTALGGAGGMVVTGALFLAGQLFSRVAARLRGQPLDEVAFGGGDVYLGGLVGLAVGWPGVLVALAAAVAAGGLFSLLYIGVQLIRGKYNPYAAIPYGPFLIFGAMLIYLYGREFAAWYAGL
jgi:leader peptidase (prepilin peptidase)/N-methyltransferase